MFDVRKVKPIDLKDESNAYLYQGDLSIDELKQFKDYIKEMEVTKMTKKFTEEQYLEIIRTYENNYGPGNKAMAVIRVVDSFNESLSYNEALALANPVTRELAHEQFVEKEKKYVWELKSDNGLAISNLNGQWFLDKTPSDIECFSEAEIENSPFKPEWFDKEEVD